MSASAILKIIERQPKHIAGYKQIVRELGTHGEARSEIAASLRQLVASGQLKELDSGRYALAAVASPNTLVGRLSVHRDGFGFVTPDAGSLDERLKARLAGDIFIPAPSIGSAMHGDKVLVDVVAFRANGRAEGRIVRSVLRAHPTVVGIFHYGTRHNYVTPIDQKLSQAIIIPKGLEYPRSLAADGALSSEANAARANSPHPSRDRVLGSDQGGRSQPLNLEDVVVDVEITDWASFTQSPRGRVQEILGHESEFGVDVEMIIRKFHLPHRFPPEVLKAAAETQPAISAEELGRRRDFRALPIVTIDGETARDFDDAVTVRRLDNGNFELQVHIADVAHYVRSDSALDQEARLRGTSVYFPDRAVPMLPLELSTDICSLRPQLDRLTLSCVMEIDHQGAVVQCEFSEGVIRSLERMTYTQVNAVLEGDAALGERYGTLVATFELMRDLSTILYRKRERRGSIDFDLPEAVIQFDELGLMKGITRSERNAAHRLIEEFMLTANECVATYLEERGIASLHRVHEIPDAKRVYDFEIIAATFGYSLGVGPLAVSRVHFKSERRANYGTGKRATPLEIPKEVHITPRMYQKLTTKIAGKPEERILSFLMLRSLKQARYSEENLGHFALAATNYTHFTSPIRRYPDLIVHRILKDRLRNSPERREGEIPFARFPAGDRPLSAPARGVVVAPWSKRRSREASSGLPPGAAGPLSLSELHDIADESSRAERRAVESERELMEWKKVRFMQDRVGEDFDGLVISITKIGLFVELTDLFVEGLVPIDTLLGDRFVYHENTREIIGLRTRVIYRLGQRVRVVLDRIDPGEKKLQFSLGTEPPVVKKAPRGK